jgi:hypothetical protein
MKRVALVLVAFGILGMAASEAFAAGGVRVAVGYGPAFVRPVHPCYHGGPGPMLYPPVWRHPAVIVPAPVYPPVIYPPVYTVPSYYPAPYGFGYYGSGISVGVGF